MKKAFVIICTFLLCKSYAQTSIFEDNKGESAFKLFDNAITVNTGNESIAASFNLLSRASGVKFNRWGVNMKIGANEGISNIKSNKGFLIDGSLGIYYGKKTTANPVKDSEPGWARETYVSLNLLVDRNQLYNLENNSDNQVYTKGYAGWKFETGKFGYLDNWLYGAAVNFGQTTNSADLKQNTVSTLITSANNDSVLVYRQQSAFDAAKFVGSEFYLHLNADIAYALNANKLGEQKQIPPLFAAFHFRYEVKENNKPKFNPAVGFYMGHVGAPRKIVAGLNFQANDLFNVDNTPKSTMWKRVGISFTAGFKL